MEEWKNEPDGLKKILKFTTFTELTAFLMKLGPVVDGMNHHPDFDVRKAVEIRFSLSTHSEKSVTEKDKKLAAKIDELYLEGFEANR